MYAAVGLISNELLSFNGRVLVHDNREEIEWLLSGIKTIKLPKVDIGRPLMRLKDHPDIPKLVKWPLDRKEWLEHGIGARW